MSHYNKLDTNKLRYRQNYIGSCSCNEMEETKSTTVNYADLGWTTLHSLIQQNNFEAAKLIISSGQGLNIPDKFNRTPLSIAASKGNLNIMQLLLECGAEIDKGYPLHYACDSEHLSCILFLLKNGANVNLKNEDTYPLIISARKGNLEACKLLVKYGADVSVVDISLETALHWACESENEDLITFLIDSGCDIDAFDKYELTPLIVCLVRKENKTNLVKLLLDKGASPNTSDTFSYSPLHSSNNQDSILTLINYGAQINKRTYEGITPLFELLMHADNSYIHFLLEHGADPNIQRTGGDTSLHLATEKNDIVLVNLLLKFGADPNIPNAKNIIPIHIAASNEDLEITDILLRHGSFCNIPVINIPDVNAVFIKYLNCKDGLTPIDIAAVKNDKIYHLLLENSAKDDSFTNFSGEDIAGGRTTYAKTNIWPSSIVIKMVIENDLDGIKGYKHNIELKDALGWTLLHHSVYCNLLDMTFILIKLGYNVNAVDRHNRTALSIAAAKNYVNLLKLLLDNNANINIGFPLFYAAENESIDCLLELLAKGCSTDLKNEQSESVLMRSLSPLKTDVVKILLKHGAALNILNYSGETALHVACSSDIKAVELLLDHNVDLINIGDKFKATPLHVVCHRKSIGVIKCLLEHGADSNIGDDTCWTPLHIAVADGNEEVVLELIRAGSDVNALSDIGETPMFHASDHLIIMKILIDFKADLNIRTDGGWSVLHESVYFQNVDCIEELLKNGACVNASSAENVSPLYVAATVGSLPVVKILLEAGAYVNSVILDTPLIMSYNSASFNLRTKYKVVPGNTPLIAAVSKNETKIVSLLISFGASVEITNCYGNSALHEAAENGFDQIVKQLLDAGASSLVKNNQCKSPLDLARLTGHDIIVNMMEFYK